MSRPMSDELFFDLQTKRRLEFGGVNALGMPPDGKCSAKGVCVCVCE
jgi:hypothetical protein